MKFDFDRRIARAEELSKTYLESSHLLGFYIQIARLQKSVFSQQPARIQDLMPFASNLARLTKPSGPEPPDQSTVLGISEEALFRVWERDRTVTEGEWFLARILLQPYAEYAADRGPLSFEGGGSACPFCGARPVAGVLRGEGDGGKRSLICSLCSTEWEFRRIVCPNCGEEDKEKLPVYVASQMDHVRVEACDTCRTYIKSVDLTRNGHAVPVVDELATVALNIWAEDQDYMKLEPNLLGM